MQQKIYNMLMVTYRNLLNNCYQKVFFSDSEIPAVKTFDDYLTDFYLYLYEAKPKYVQDDVKGYYLQQVRDEKALPGWLHQTFKRFLLEENEVLRKMQDSLADYRQLLATSINSKPIDITLMHVAFAIAWFNQHETSEDKYLFFRSAYKHFKGFYTWPDDDLDDDDVARVLDIKPGTLRTRTSRLCAKVKDLIHKLTDANIATLNKQSLDIAKEIYDVPNPDIEAILERLLGNAEKELDQYENIVALRKSKRLSKEPLQKVCEEKASTSVFRSISKVFGSKTARIQENVCYSAERECIDFEMDDMAFNPCIENSSTSNETSNKIVRIFKEIIDDDGDNSFTP